MYKSGAFINAGFFSGDPPDGRISGAFLMQDPLRETLPGLLRIYGIKKTCRVPQLHRSKH